MITYFKKIRFGFVWEALLLFGLLMLPNIIWLFVEVANDPLRIESVTPLLDIFSTIFQVLMIAALIFLKQDDQKKTNYKSPLLISVAFFILIYFISWILYYCGITNLAILGILTVAPSLAFVLFAIERKNWLALCFAVIFTGLHFSHYLINFVL